MRVATIANCFAPHTSCSLRVYAMPYSVPVITLHLGILNMLVVVRSAPYLYLRIEGDPWIELYRLRYLPDHRQVRSTVHNQLQFLAYVSTFPLFYTKYHFEADRHSDRDKPYKDNIGQHQSRDKRHNSFMYSRSWQRPPRHHSYWKSSRSQIVWSPTADASVE